MGLTEFSGRTAMKGVPSSKVVGWEKRDTSKEFVLMISSILLVPLWYDRFMYSSRVLGGRLAMAFSCITRRIEGGTWLYNSSSMSRTGVVYRMTEPLDMVVLAMTPSPRPGRDC